MANSVQDWETQRYKLQCPGLSGNPRQFLGLIEEHFELGSARFEGQASRPSPTRVAVSLMGVAKGQVWPSPCDKGVVGVAYLGCAPTLNHVGADCDMKVCRRLGRAPTLHYYPRAWFDKPKTGSKDLSRRPKESHFS